MAPLPPSTNTTTNTYNSHSRGLRRGHEEKTLPSRSSSFHGRPTEKRQIRRPKTQPDLITWRTMGPSPEDNRNRSTAVAAAGEVIMRVPAKVLVNVTVHQSLGPLQVMASTEWSVADLISAAVQFYVKERRRPPLPTTEPSAFGLHFSQFSLESLDTKEKLFGLGSRNFFLCPKSCSSNISDTATLPAASDATTCSKEAEKASKIGIPWLRFMDFLL
ncbi:uncharacterized protein [Typha latifolia]|uniref:uncharacterized protein n=1 Tax=Typha latifolia TaxID=4733 RepID=UPI003C2BB4FB